MSERRPSETGIARHELEPTEGLMLPGDRPDGYFAAGEPVVVFAPATSESRLLRNATVEPSTNGERRITVRLEIPLPPMFMNHGKYKGKDNRLFTAGVREPFIMKREEYEQLHGNAEAVRRWVDGVTDYNKRQLSQLASNLIRAGVSTARASIGRPS